jgi:fructose-bisphosphate aldolase class I
LLQDLRAGQSDEEFDAALGSAIDQICEASVAG